MLIKLWLSNPDNEDITWDLAPEEEDDWHFDNLYFYDEWQCIDKPIVSSAPYTIEEPSKLIAEDLPPTLEVIKGKIHCSFDHDPPHKFTDVLSDKKWRIKVGRTFRGRTPRLCHRRSRPSLTYLRLPVLLLKKNNHLRRGWADNWETEEDIIHILIEDLSHMHNWEYDEYSITQETAPGAVSRCIHDKPKLRPYGGPYSMGNSRALEVYIVL